MPNVIQITPDFAIASQLSARDVERAAAMGFRTLVNNRPDGEEQGQPSSAEIESVAQGHELSYAYVPTTRHDIFSDGIVSRMHEVLTAASGPVLAYCKSGQRCAIVWAAAMARSRPVAEVLENLNAAGLDFSVMREELERQSRHRTGDDSAPSSAHAA